MIDYVVGFLFSPDFYHVVLIRKNKPEWQNGYLNGVGGKIEPGEHPIQAMIREFDEEAGLHINSWRQVGTGHNHRARITVFTTFSEDYCKVFARTDEPISIHRTESIGHLRVLPNLRWLIPLSINVLNRTCQTPNAGLYFSFDT